MAHLREITLKNQYHSNHHLRIHHHYTESPFFSRRIQKSISHCRSKNPFKKNQAPKKTKIANPPVKNDRHPFFCCGSQEHGAKCARLPAEARELDRGTRSSGRRLGGHDRSFENRGMAEKPWDAGNGFCHDKGRVTYMTVARLWLAVIHVIRYT